MTQRTLAAVLAVPLFVALVLFAALSPLPYVTYGPGLTINVLGDQGGSPIIDVQGHKTYRDPGQLRMTTVSVTRPKAHLDLFTLMKAWSNHDDAVYPYASVYSSQETDEQSSQQGAAEMVTSQDSATAAALTELGYHVKGVIEVVSIGKGTPADGKLQVRDVLVSVDGTKVTQGTDVASLVQKAPQGQPLTIVVRRGSDEHTLHITPAQVDGVPRIGVQLSVGFVLPFKVSVNIPQDIGGPSAGLMFSLGIYDTLTPGSLTGDAVVAGTGTIDQTGKVGPIGGIQQKIAGAREAGARLFLVPPDNCSDALGAHPGDMRLVRADTMHDAVQAITAWVKDHNATLPSCTDKAGS